MLGINMNQDMVSRMASVLGVSRVGLVFILFGFTLRMKSNFKLFLEKVVEKVARRLDGWKKFFFCRLEEGLH